MYFYLCKDFQTRALTLTTKRLTINFILNLTKQILTFNQVLTLK